MPYVIKQKSRHLCQIRYENVRSSYLIQVILARTLLVGSIVVIFGGLMWMLGTWVIILGVIFLNLGRYLWDKAEPSVLPLPEFEITLDRFKGRVSVRSSENPNAKPVTYSLSSFRGFVSRETTLQYKSKQRLQAELFLKLEPVTGMVRDVPVRKRKYCVSPNNADVIVETTDRWLNPAPITGEVKTTKAPEAAVPNKSVARDFRDME